MAATIGVVRELRAGETRVAITPDAVKKYAGLGLSILIESGAGVSAAVPDADYLAAGATIAPSAEQVLSTADVVLCVRPPLAEALTKLKPGAVLIGLINPYGDPEAIKALAASGASAFAMEFVPRITRAQSMDALSSQANLAGYRAVIIMGVGVAGLQAIATARRLGAVVTATDVRPATKEQVESLGAKFLAVEDEEFKNAQTAGGYAKQMSAEYQAKQAALVSEHIKKQDIVVTTALIPGRPAPKLVSADQVNSMKAGSVIVDLAVEAGGNCELAKAGETVETPGGVKIVGIPNLAGRIAADASNLYARNLFNLMGLLVKDGALITDFEDEILKAALVTQGGAVVHSALKAG
jgi:NAD(P) transhydrogenase subunit alpha